jgi:hypothetical protein
MSGLLVRSRQTYFEEVAKYRPMERETGLEPAAHRRGNVAAGRCCLSCVSVGARRVDEVADDPDKARTQQAKELQYQDHDDDCQSGL